MAAVSMQALAMREALLLHLPRARAFSGAATQAPSAGFQRLRYVLFMGDLGSFSDHPCNMHVVGNAACVATIASEYAPGIQGAVRLIEWLAAREC
jgi:hypothetical protein